MWFILFCSILIGYIVHKLIQFIRADADLALLSMSIKKEYLKNKWIWVTGASSGLGEHICYALAMHGSNIILSARRENELERVKKECLRLNPNIQIHIQMLDLCNFDSHEEIVKQVIQHTHHVDILINNAGRTQRGTVEDTKFSVYPAICNVNVLGPISLTTAVLPYMIKRNKGHIVAISSLAGKLGAPLQAGYAMSKHAIQGFYDSLRLEVCNNNINVTLICPGPVSSNSMNEAFSSVLNEKVLQPESTSKRMNTDRFATLALKGITNCVYECWISLHPSLLFVYLYIYMPGFAKRIGCKIGIERIRAYKNGGDAHGAFDGMNLIKSLFK